METIHELKKRSHELRERAAKNRADSQLLADKTRTLTEKFLAKGWRVQGSLDELKLKGETECNKMAK